MSTFDLVHDALQRAAEWLSLALTASGAVMIMIGAVRCLGRLIRTPRPGTRGSASARLVLASSLAMALEFALAADIVDTSTAPSWTRIGHLAAIGAIRTALNWFLSRDMAEDRRLVEEGVRTPSPPAA